MAKAFLAILFGSLMWYLAPPDAYHKNDYVLDVLVDLGMEPPAHYSAMLDTQLVKMGEDLIFLGKTDRYKGYSGFISKFYNCTSCHNTVRERPDLSKIDVTEKLDYAVANNLAMLQGSSFYGVANMESWYNDDYYLKYGDLVKPANKSLSESIQLCAQECAQGRKLKAWELEAIKAYLQSISYRLSDLNLSISEWDKLNEQALSAQDKIKLLKSKYMQKNPATFGDIPASKATGYEGITGNPEKGALIYKYACQSCHLEEGESDVLLDMNPLTFKWLEKNITKNSPGSFYEIIRKGTYSESGHREYMPNFTKEKLSNQQIEDLRAFIEKMAK